MGYFVQVSFACRKCSQISENLCRFPEHENLLFYSPCIWTPPKDMKPLQILELKVLFTDTIFL